MSELGAVLVESCRAGDGHAFRALVDCYQDRVYALTRSLAGASDAEDLAQETFVRVHRAIRRFDPQGPARLGTWILTIARRLCQDRARGARLRLEVALEGTAEPAAPAPSSNPEDQLAQARLGARLERAIAALPEEQRAALALREWDGLEYEEIAAIEAIPVGTVRSRLARARQTLREVLALDGGGPQGHGPSKEERHASGR